MAPEIQQYETEDEFCRRLQNEHGLGYECACQEARKQALERAVVNMPPSDFETMRAVLLRLIRGC